MIFEDQCNLNFYILKLEENIFKGFLVVAMLLWNIVTFLSLHRRRKQIESGAARLIFRNIEKKKSNS